MTDYFNNERQKSNNDTLERTQNRPKCSLQKSLRYDRDFVNRTLNKPVLEDADKYNIASVLGQCSQEYWNSVQTHKGFEEFLYKKMGKDWFNKMTAEWFDEKSRETTGVLIFRVSPNAITIENPNRAIAKR